MNPAQLHLALNHFPIAGICFGLLFLIWGVFKSSNTARQAGLVLFILSALLVAPLFLTGEGAEEIVEGKPLVTEDVIHEHEEAGELALILTIASGVLAFGALVLHRRQHKLAQPALILTLVSGIASAVTLGRTAHFGGMIRHDEIRSGVVSESPESQEEKEEE